MRFAVLAVVSAAAALAVLLVVASRGGAGEVLTGSAARGASEATSLRSRRLSPGQRLDLLIEEALGKEGRRLMATSHSIGMCFDTAISHSNTGVTAGRRSATNFKQYGARQSAYHHAFNEGKQNSGKSFQYASTGRLMSQRSAAMTGALYEANPDNEVLQQIHQYVQGDQFAGPIQTNAHYSGRMLQQVSPHQGAAQVQRSGEQMQSMLQQMDKDCAADAADGQCKTPDEYAHEAVHSLFQGVHALLHAVTAMGDQLIANYEDEAMKLVDVAISNLVNFR